MDVTDNHIQKAPDDFIGLVVNTDKSLTLQDYIDANELIQFENQIAENRWDGFIYINPYVMENNLPDCYLGRWNHTAEMCNLISQYGLRTFEEYKADDLHRQGGVGGGAYLLEDRKKIPSAVSKFGSKQLLTFCDDYHDEYLDYIAENWTFEDFISWGKQEFIFVEFEDLPFFDFPEKKPDYYNVMILTGSWICSKNLKKAESCLYSKKILIDTATKKPSKLMQDGCLSIPLRP